MLQKVEENEQRTCTMNETFGLLSVGQVDKYTDDLAWLFRFPFFFVLSL